MQKVPLNRLTPEEWAKLLKTGMAYEFYPEGPPIFTRTLPVVETPDGSDAVVKFGEDSE